MIHRRNLVWNFNQRLGMNRVTGMTWRMMMKIMIMIMQPNKFFQEGEIIRYHPTCLDQVLKFNKPTKSLILIMKWVKAKRMKLVRWQKLNNPQLLRKWRIL
jgi:hypothetical protein